MARIEIGDIVQVGTGGSSYHAVVRGVRLRRLVVDRCDGLPALPLSTRDVVAVFKPAGTPEAAVGETEPLLPTAQMRLL
ncbi:MAG: hypothetical protein V9E83_04535 [Baekduia sp.]